MERGSNIIFFIILRLLGRISSEKREGDGNFGEEYQDKKIVSGVQVDEMIIGGGMAFTFRKIMDNMPVSV